MSTPDSLAETPAAASETDTAITFNPAWAASHVKGGTSTAKNDELEEASFREAEGRRDQALADKQRSVHVNAPQSEANTTQTIAEAVTQQKGLMYSYKPGNSPNMPTGVIPIKYVNRHGEEYDEGIADLYLGTPDDANELLLILFCPKCITRKKHEQDCIVHLRQRNRNFVFTPKSTIFRYEGELIRSLGTIEESEKFSCPHCQWQARFDRNRVRED